MTLVFPKILQNKWIITALIQCCAWTGYAEEITPKKGLPLFYWQEKWHGKTFVNFGDYISVKLVERIVNSPLRTYTKAHKTVEKKLLGTGSIISFASDHDIVWGSGINGKLLRPKYYKFNGLDIRCVRGPLTRQFITEQLNLYCPEIYGDPALLFPYFFPEFTRKENPTYDYIIIPHFSEEDVFSKEEWDNVVYSTDPWDEVVAKILDSRFVISSSLHGIIIAEAYGIPARLLRAPHNEEPLFKFQDYYSGTGRPDFSIATSVNEAFEMGGEPPFQCDLEKIYEVFPFEYWQEVQFQLPKLQQN